MALDGMTGAATTLVAAALETQGYVIQSKLLDAFESPELRNLAGLLYLIGIVGAVLIIAVGGNYKFGKYLLLGPVLFFFLTTERSATGGADWRFADNTRPISRVQEMLEDLPQADSMRVSTFFHLWNMLVTDVVQTLIGFLNLTAAGNDVNFVGKLERYMNYVQNLAEIDPKLSFFLEVALVNDCADYYNMQRDLESTYTDDITKEAIRERLAQRRNDMVIDFSADQHLALRRWAREAYNEELTGQYTCEGLWTLAVRLLQAHARNLLETLGRDGRPEDLQDGDIWSTLLKKFRTEAEHASGQIRVGNADLMLLVNEIVARRLFNHMMHRTQALGAYDTNRFGATYRFGGRQQVAETARAIGELQGTEQWQFKGDLFVGSLSLPYIQGLCLYGLAMAFPFFALVMVIPGRHHALTMWMSLWVWLKSWDLGMAVVMMIDNMLYAMFPRGPGVTPTDITNPGRAWTAIMAIDPTYTAHTYYNIVATCLFAVPIVTGVFVKKGAGEVVDAVTNSMNRHTTAIAGSLANYHRSLLAQSKAASAQRMIYNQVRENAWELVRNDGELQRMVLQHVAATTGADGVNFVRGVLQRNLPAGGNAALGDLGGIFTTISQTYAEGREKALASRMVALLNVEAYQASIRPEIRRLASDAVRIKFNSHDFSRPFPGQAIQNAMLADSYYNIDGALSGTAGGYLRNRAK